MFKKYKLTFSKSSRDYIQEAIQASTCYLEYGSGGSTHYAATLGKTTITVESDVKWLMELCSSAAEQGILKNIIPIWADIGETKDWGYPSSKDFVDQWERYPGLAWDYCHEHGLKPDTILIDGRFRTACFLTSILNLSNPAKVIFDDYVGREYYYSVESVIAPSEIIGDRIAVFDVDPESIDRECVLAQIAIGLDPR